MVISMHILEELVYVLQRPRIKGKYNLTDKVIAEFIELIAEKAGCFTPVGRLSICRDPDDNIVLETALLGKAEYLITRDDDMKGDKELMKQMFIHNVNVRVSSCNPKVIMS